MNKNGQIQIQETILVIFVIFIILMIGMVVFFQFESRSIEAIKTENDEDTFYLMLSFVPSMPELKCSKFGIGDECIDLAKAESFENINDEPYHNVFGAKKIILDVSDKKINLYNWNPYNHVGERKITSPVSVYNPKDKKFLIGILEVYMYEE